MKKLAYIIIATLIFTGLVQPMELFVNGFFGSRSLNGSTIKDIYGNGGTFLFGAGARYKGAFAEIGYSSFNRDGESSLYNEKTEFTLKALNLRLGYEHAINEKFFPKAFIGLGSFSIKESVDSQFVPETDESKMGFLFGIGFRVDLYRGLSLEGRIENISLKVKPYDDEVNLGGWRLLIGAGFYLKLHSE
jgi:hypothetical protein